MTEEEFVKAERVRVRFHGFVRVIPKHAGWTDSALAFPQDYQRFQSSFAHIYVPNSPGGGPAGVYRHGERIGGLEEIEVLGPMEDKP